MRCRWLQRPSGSTVQPRSTLQAHMLQVRTHRALHVQEQIAMRYKDTMVHMQELSLVVRFEQMVGARQSIRLVPGNRHGAALRVPFNLYCSCCIVHMWHTHA